MKRKSAFILSQIITAVSLAQGPVYPRGLPAEPDTMILKFKLKTTLITSDYKGVSSAASLKDYCPTPGNQGSYGTCAAWSTAYGARTIVEAEKNGWKSKDIINQNTFSPGFIFKVVKPYDLKCGGSFPSDLFSKMKEIGVPHYSDFNQDCSYPPEYVFPKALPYKIQDAVDVFNSYDLGDLDNENVYKVKKSIYEGNPVVVSFYCPASFDVAKDVWLPYEPKTEINGRMHGKHAITVIGYDDLKYGGAFEIMNSWGTTWGNMGFTWIKYADFKKYVYSGVELIKFDKFKTPIENAAFSGMIKLTDLNDQEFLVQQVSAGYYKLVNNLTTDDRFRIYVSNYKPANVYVIGADLSKNVNVLFPNKPNISPALNYSNATIALPDENHHIKLGKTRGTDYLIFLYSKAEIDINNLTLGLKTGTTNYMESLKRYFGNKLISGKNIKGMTGKIGFETQNATEGVMAVIVEINHK